METTGCHKFSKWSDYKLDTHHMEPVTEQVNVAQMVSKQFNSLCHSMTETTCQKGAGQRPEFSRTVRIVFL